MPTETMAPGPRPQAPVRTETRSVVSLATESDQSAWDAYVAAHAEATGYHEWAWRAIFTQTFGHEAVYVMARDADGNVRGVLPTVHIKSLLFGRTLTSLPFLNYGGVLADDDQVARALVDAAAEQARARGCQHLELR